MRLEYFQMIDRVRALDPEARTIQTDCAIPEASPIFEGHFPGHPIMPGVLLIETMAQTGGWLIMAMLRFRNVPFLGQVKEAKMRAFVSPGDALIGEATLLHDGSGYAVASARLTRDGREVASADITYRVLPFPNDTMRGQMLDAARRLQVPDAYLEQEAPHAG